MRNIFGIVVVGTILVGVAVVAASAPTPYRQAGALILGLLLVCAVLDYRKALQVAKQLRAPAEPRASQVGIQLKANCVSMQQLARELPDCVERTRLLHALDGQAELLADLERRH